ncbi:MAG: formate dehydrogenase accessory sulfurtransferase FdhD [Deltaproteobacteria bacterium]|nr:formate dehydrogenase accessory sulfurtransferase FdhD [Deltaproteobacteria bacterium]
MSAAVRASEAGRSVGTAAAGTRDAASIRDLPAGATHVTAGVIRSGAWMATQECVAQEVAVSFELDGEPHVVMLATPADLEDFALGFCLTEGLIDEPADLRSCEIRLREKGIVLALSRASERAGRGEEPRRNLTGRTGCGLCGTDDLERVIRMPRRPLPPTRIEPAAFARAMGALGDEQPLGLATGATHAAAFCDLDGGIRLVREDVGRHNALDKLIGALLRAGLDPGQGFAAVTSRASVEMVQKTALAGIPILAAVSAPTQLAIQLARDVDLLLAGFVRGDRATIYAGAARLRSGD